ncbi:site-specific integrase [Duganella hordei]|uniref:site-specific integrase n=1 Tax=Duganella hordei TaxID=2865934 RepID=UPI0030EA4187
MTALARKTVLPKFTLTVLAEKNDPLATRISTSDEIPYFTRPKYSANNAQASDGSPPPQYRLFPLILNGDGSPWAEANLYILGLLDGDENPKMATVTSIAEDLAAFKRFLENQPSINWLHFPENRLLRPTYRFNGHLRTLCRSAEIAWSTAKRRMAVVVRFYRWLVEERVFEPKNPLWKESERYVHFTDSYGSPTSKRVATTDLSIQVPSQDDPYDGFIDDGAKLRPLPANEQQWLLDALISLGNTELTLIHIFALVTGARIQTILTFRVGDIINSRPLPSQGPIRFPVGPGTGIDTKQDKRLVLHIPVWFYEMLQTYALSNRARNRRLRANGGDTHAQYLFLTTRAVPFYLSKYDNGGSRMSGLRHGKVGQGVRQYITDYILPSIREEHGAGFQYRFHDLRATFGMNVLDEKLKLVQEKRITLAEALNYLQTVMGHSSLSVTERYVNYRGRLKLARSVQDEWELNIAKIASTALGHRDLK